MSRLPVRKAVTKLLSEDFTSLLRDSRDYVGYRLEERWHPFKRRQSLTEDLFRRNGVNVCYNSNIPDSYDPSKRNILVAVESPAVVEHEGWLDESMNFDAEISFGDFYDLDRYHCPRTIYTTNDNFVDLDTSRSYENKSGLVSLVYSESDHLPGHKLRHGVADELGSELDIYGSGPGTYTDRFWSQVHQAYLERKESSLAEHRFQVVIENIKHPNYVSEKFYDSLKTHTVPIYRGGEESVRKMGFDIGGVIFFETVEELRSILDELSPERYRKMRPAVERNRERLVEIRRENRFQFILNSVMHGYMHSVESYHQRDYDELSLQFE